MKKILCKILVILSLLLSILSIVGLCVAENDDPEQQLIDNVEQNVDDLDLGSLQGLLQGLNSNLFDSLKDTIKDIAQGEQ